MHRTDLSNLAFTLLTYLLYQQRKAYIPPAHRYPLSPAKQSTGFLTENM